MFPTTYKVTGSRPIVESHRLPCALLAPNWFMVPAVTTALNDCRQRKNEIAQAIVAYYYYRKGKSLKWISCRRKKRTELECLRASLLILLCSNTELLSIHENAFKWIFRMDSSKVFAVPLQRTFEWSSICNLSIKYELARYELKQNNQAKCLTAFPECIIFTICFLKIENEQLNVTPNSSGPYVRRICIFATISNSKHFFFFHFWCCSLGIHREKKIPLIRNACLNFQEHTLVKMANAILSYPKWNCMFNV